MRKNELVGCPQWLLDADTLGEDVAFNSEGVLIWSKGQFWGGEFWGGEFLSGQFRGGQFRGGQFWGGEFLGGEFLSGEFLGGEFLGGQFRGGQFFGEVLTSNPITLGGFRWSIYGTPTFLHIGCQHHTHEAWESFSEGEIAEMAVGALEFWRKNKQFLLSLCDNLKGNLNHE